MRRTGEAEKWLRKAKRFFRRFAAPPRTKFTTFTDLKLGCYRCGRFVLIATDAVLFVKAGQLVLLRERDEVPLPVPLGLESQLLADQPADPLRGDLFLVIVPVPVDEPTRDVFDGKPCLVRR